MKLRTLPCTLAATLVLASLAGPSALVAQNPATTAPAQTPAPASTNSPVTGNTTVTTGADGKQQENVSLTLTNAKPKKAPKAPKTERGKQTKDVKQEVKKVDKFNALAGKDQQLPDKQLYDKALAQEKSAHFDVARLDLQTLLNTYPDSPYQMRAKLAIADCWYREGGTAALTQAAQEYLDFETFFPNAPEASEAQMRIGDIYFKQMDVPDRDYVKAIKAEDAYRTMLKQYPDAPKDIIAQTKQKLREVQEVLAIRDSSIAAFYATHLNWPATIARYQTVVDTYPQYSHMDDTLIGIGDAYEAEANMVRVGLICTPGMKFGTACFTEASKASLLQEFDGKAATAYRRVVLEHAAAPHVEDAKERLIAMNLPVPTPTAQQVAASEELEGSRAQYTMAKRLQVMFMHSPDTVVTARVGEPPLEDLPPTSAPSVVRYLTESYKHAGDPKDFATPRDPDPNNVVSAPAAPAAPSSPGPAAPAASGAAPTLSDVPVSSGSGDPSIGTVEAAQPSTGGGTGVGVEILSTGNGTRTATPSSSTPPSSLPAATGKPDANNGLPTVGDRGAAALPPVEKPEAAPDAINDAVGKATPPTPNKTGTKKTKAPATDKNDESSSKKKPKKGLDKLNPF
jgi:outer membrane protein assembly factor BamD